MRGDEGEAGRHVAFGVTKGIRMCCYPGAGLCCLSLSDALHDYTMYSTYRV